MNPANLTPWLFGLYVLGLFLTIPFQIILENKVKAMTVASDNLAAAVNNVKTAQANLSTTVTNGVAAIQSLAAQISAGSEDPAMQAAADSLNTVATDLGASNTALTNAVAAAVPAPAPAPPQPTA